MTFPSKLIQVHMPPLTSTEVIGSSAKGLTATGTTQADAYQLKDSVNSFSTVSGGTGTRLPACENNCMCVVNNYGASTLTIYPFESSGVTVDGGTSFQLPANKSVVFFGVQTNWIGVYDTASGGAATWGAITGTLSAQTDLQAALDDKLDASSVSAFGLTLIDDADATEARGTLELGTAATADSSDFATAAQGALADSALQSDDIGVSVQAYDVNTTKNNVANNFTQPNEFDKTSTAWTAEAYNATQTLNALVPAGTTTLTGNMTLNAVSNSTTGEMQVIVRAFTQDATGGRTLAYNTAVFSASGANFPQPTSTANRVSLFQFTKMPDGKWAVQSLNDVRST